MEVPAVITSYEVADERITLAVEVHGLPFKAELPVTPDAETRAATIMQRPVRLHGVMGTIFNRQRQMTDRHFFVPSFDEIVLSASQENGENYPLLTVSELLTSPHGPTKLVRLQGTVTQHDPRGFYLRDSSGSTLVESAKIDQLPPRTKVMAEGFGAVAPFRPVLRATRVMDLGETASIAQEATTNAIKHGGASVIRIELEYLPHHTKLVTRAVTRAMERGLLRM